MHQSKQQVMDFYINECMAMLMHEDNYDTHGFVCQLYLTNNINPFFICTGYSLQDALENALDLELLQDWDLDQLIESVTVINQIQA